MEKIPSASFYKPYRTEINMALLREKKGENIELSKKITYRSSLCGLVSDNFRTEKNIRLRLDFWSILAYIFLEI